MNLMDSLVFVEENKIFFDYFSFNRLATNDNYAVIINDIISRVQTILLNHSTFEMHVNLLTFSVTALNKHKNFIVLFSERTELFEDSFTELHLYFCPSIIDSISKLFKKIFKNSQLPQMFYHSKDKSTELLKSVFTKDVSCFIVEKNKII
jgi:hypothetical protein